MIHLEPRSTATVALVDRWAIVVAFGLSVLTVMLVALALFMH